MSRERGPTPEFSYDDPYRTHFAVPWGRLEKEIKASYKHHHRGLKADAAAQALAEMMNLRGDPLPDPAVAAARRHARQTAKGDGLGKVGRRVVANLGEAIFGNPDLWNEWTEDEHQEHRKLTEEFYRNSVKTGIQIDMVGGKVSDVMTFPHLRTVINHVKLGVPGQTASKEKAEVRIKTGKRMEISATAVLGLTPETPSIDPYQIIDPLFNTISTVFEGRAQRSGEGEKPHMVLHLDRGNHTELAIVHTTSVGRGLGLSVDMVGRATSVEPAPIGNIIQSRPLLVRQGETFPALARFVSTVSEITAAYHKQIGVVPEGEVRLHIA